VTSVPDCPWITLHEVLHWIALGEVRDISSRRAELEAVYDRVNAGEPDSGTNIQRRFAEAERRLLYALQAGEITATGKEQIMLDVTAMNTALSARHEISALWWLDAKFDVDKSIAYWPKRSIPGTCQVEELRFPRQVVMALWALTAVPEAAPFPNDATPELSKPTEVLASAAEPAERDGHAAEPLPGIKVLSAGHPGGGKYDTAIRAQLTAWTREHLGAPVNISAVARRVAGQNATEGVLSGVRKRIKKIIDEVTG
jgi:hypothetical protein